MKHLDKFNFNTINDFDNHISGSILGYDLLYQLIINISSYFANENSVIIDFGCTSGKLINKIAEIYKPNLALGYDITNHNFIEGCANLIEIDLTKIDLQIPTFDIGYCVFLFQFIDPKKRIDLVNKIYRSLRKGGVLIVCEKEYSRDGQINEIFTFVNYENKINKFTAEEIIKKEHDLRSIMHPFTSTSNVSMLLETGFVDVEPFFQSLNFKGYICKK
jgi:tRNA (cmo5U34)-methyltransferase